MGDGKIGVNRRGNFPCCAVNRQGKLRVTLKRPTCMLHVGTRGGAIVLKSTRRLGTRCVLMRSCRVARVRSLLRYGSLSMHVHCHDGPVPYRILMLSRGRLLIHFLSRTSTVTPKRSTIFCRKGQMLKNTFVTSRHNVQGVTTSGRSGF